jgi:hypothetical protein
MMESFRTMTLILNYNDCSAVSQKQSDMARNILQYEKCNDMK